jgi:protein-disulfide isomerase
MTTTAGDARGRLQTLIEWATTLAALISAVVVVWVALGVKRTVGPQPGGALPPLPSKPLSLHGAVLLGSTSAPAALMIFSDFQCPSCGHFARDAFEQIQQYYIKPGRLLFAFRNFPLDGHPQARGAAVAAGCAGLQGQFWPMHDEIFRDQRHLDAASFRMRADSLGLNRVQFDGCLAGQAEGQIESDLAIGNSLTVEATPTFFIGQLLPDFTVKVVERLQGDRPWSDYQAALDKVTKD